MKEAKKFEEKRDKNIVSIICEITGGLTYTQIREPEKFILREKQQDGRNV